MDLFFGDIQTDGQTHEANALHALCGNFFTFSHHYILQNFYYSQHEGLTLLVGSSGPIHRREDVTCIGVTSRCVTATDNGLIVVVQAPEGSQGCAGLRNVRQCRTHGGVGQQVDDLRVGCVN